MRLRLLHPRAVSSRDNAASRSRGRPRGTPLRTRASVSTQCAEAELACAQNSAHSSGDPYVRRASSASVPSATTIFSGSTLSIRAQDDEYGPQSDSNVFRPVEPSLEMLLTKSARRTAALRARNHRTAQRSQTIHDGALADQQTSAPTSTATQRLSHDTPNHADLTAFYETRGYSDLAGEVCDIEYDDMLPNLRRIALEQAGRARESPGDPAASLTAVHDAVAECLAYFSETAATSAGPAAAAEFAAKRELFEQNANQDVHSARRSSDGEWNPTDDRLPGDGHVLRDEYRFEPDQACANSSGIDFDAAPHSDFFGPGSIGLTAASTHPDALPAARGNSDAGAAHSYASEDSGDGSYEGWQDSLHGVVDSEDDEQAGRYSDVSSRTSTEAAGPHGRTTLQPLHTLYRPGFQTNDRGSGETQCLDPLHGTAPGRGTQCGVPNATLIRAWEQERSLPVLSYDRPSESSGRTPSGSGSLVMQHAMSSCTADSGRSPFNSSAASCASGPAADLPSSPSLCKSQAPSWLSHGKSHESVRPASATTAQAEPRSGAPLAPLTRKRDAAMLRASALALGRRVEALSCPDQEPSDACAYDHRRVDRRPITAGSFPCKSPLLHRTTSHPRQSRAHPCTHSHSAIPNSTAHEPLTNGCAGVTCPHVHDGHEPLGMRVSGLTRARRSRGCSMHDDASRPMSDHASRADTQTSAPSSKSRFRGGWGYRLPWQRRPAESAANARRPTSPGAGQAARASQVRPDLCSVGTSTEFPAESGDFGGFDRNTARLCQQAPAQSVPWKRTPTRRLLTALLRRTYSDKQDPPQPIPRPEGHALELDPVGDADDFDSNDVPHSYAGEFATAWFSGAVPGSLAPERNMPADRRANREGGVKRSCSHHATTCV